MSANIRGAIALRRSSQGQLAAALALSEPAISRRMSAATQWTIDELVEVARVLQLPLTALLPGSGASLVERIPSQAHPAAS